jgi:hypothetical protein
MDTVHRFRKAFRLSVILISEHNGKGSSVARIEILHVLYRKLTENTMKGLAQGSGLNLITSQ